MNKTRFLKRKKEVEMRSMAMRVILKCLSGNKIILMIPFLQIAFLGISKLNFGN